MYPVRVGQAGRSVKVYMIRYTHPSVVSPRYYQTPNGKAFWTKSGYAKNAYVQNRRKGCIWNHFKDQTDVECVEFDLSGLGGRVV